ncbi:hypothetical protein QCD79_32070, partial [Pseudomonas quasicaspiana]|nr:hypothetical protein [Pseudomonas quasicaspiana]
MSEKLTGDIVSGVHRLAWRYSPGKAADTGDYIPGQLFRQNVNRLDHFLATFAAKNNFPGLGHT